MIIKKIPLLLSVCSFSITSLALACNGGPGGNGGDGALGGGSGSRGGIGPQGKGKDGRDGIQRNRD